MKKATLYSLAKCRYCPQAIDLIEECGVRKGFQVNVVQDDLNAIKKARIAFVPTLDVEGEKITGLENIKTFCNEKQ